MNAKKIVFFDIDHTIYDPIRKTIPKATQEAFEKLSQKDDVVIAIATGRAFYMLDIIDSLKPYIEVYITINGQVIVHKNKVIYEKPLDKATINTVKNVFHKHQLVYGCIGIEHQAINRIDEDAVRMFEEASMPLPIEDARFDQHAKVYQMWAFADSLTFERVQQDLRDYQLVSWLSDGFDVVLADQSKKDGIKRVLKHLDIPLEQAYAFGDGENDIEMLEYIPHSFAMGNAKDHIKHRATHTTERYDEGGIYNALIKMKLIDE